MAEKDKIEAKVLHNGSNQKTIVITTDGSNINIQTDNINALEAEMMVLKTLNAMRRKEVDNANS